MQYMEKGDTMPKQSRKQQAYNSIKHKILSCEYMPSSFLNEDLLCEEFQVSRTPIRDALSRLEQEHLIKIIPKKGFIVSPLTVGEINMAFEVRFLLEPYVILNYCKNMNYTDLDKMFAIVEECRMMNKTSPKEDLYESDDNFHQIIMNQCTNRYVLQTYANVQDQNCRFRILSGRYEEQRLKSTIDEHLSILDNLAKGNLEPAAEQMKSHLDNSKQAAFRTFLNSNNSII